MQTFIAVNIKINYEYLHIYKSVIIRSTYPPVKNIFYPKLQISFYRNSKKFTYRLLQHSCKYK